MTDKPKDEVVRTNGFKQRTSYWKKRWIKRFNKETSEAHASDKYTPPKRREK